MNKREYVERNKKIVELDKQGLLKRQIAIECDCSLNVVRNVLSGSTGIRIYD